MIVKPYERAIRSVSLLMDPLDDLMVDWLPPILWPVTLWPWRLVFVVLLGVLWLAFQPLFVPARFRE